jgi:UDP-3-O-[3-hydroxymyristoyl] glucosamine N-acyltransferase
MSGVREFVLLGAGSLAVEVASYVVDLAAATGGASAEASGPLISDVVAPEAGRIDDIARIAGAGPAVHRSIDTVKGLERKAAIVCNGDPEVRDRLFADAVAKGLHVSSLIHPSAIISPTAKIGPGTIICPFVFVGPFAAIEENMLVNVRATIGHDVTQGATPYLTSL